MDDKVSVNKVWISKNVSLWARNIIPWFSFVLWLPSWSISEVTKSQRNRRRQRRLQIFQKKFYIQSCKNKNKVVDSLVQKLLNDMTLDWYPSMNSSLHVRQALDDKCFRCQSCRFVLLRTWKHVISRCKVYLIAPVRTLSWEGIEFGNFILIAAIHYWNQLIENSMSSSSLGCDFVTSLLIPFKVIAKASRMSGSLNTLLAREMLTMKTICISRVFCISWNVFPVIGACKGTSF